MKLNRMNFYIMGLKGANVVLITVAKIYYGTA